MKSVPGTPGKTSLRELLSKYIVSKDWSYDRSITTNNRDEPEIFPTMCTNENYRMIECLLNMPSYQDEDNPLTMINIANHQQNDQHLMETAQHFPLVFPTKIINNINIVCKHEEFTLQDDEWRIVIPAAMIINHVIRRYHLVLGHPRTKRLYDTINARFFYPGLSTLCKDYRCPDDCDMIKNQGQQYGHLAPREVALGPWHTISVDLIGPWMAAVNE